MMPGMTPTRVLLLRHGQTAWNSEGRWQGQSGPTLNELGQRQASAAADRLAPEPIDAVYTSDLPRATETAATIAERLAIVPIVEPGLREVDVGDWTGLSREQVRDRHPDGFERWLSGESGWRGGETYQEMHARAVATVSRLVRLHPAGTIAAITHGGVIRALTAHAVGLPGHDRRRIVGVENCSLTVVETGVDGALSLVAFNDIGHLIALRPA
jgi:broad specificity phosphatase PhoE